MTISDSTFDHNSALGWAGAIFNCYNKDLPIWNVTLSQNSASYGGGIAAAKATGSLINGTQGRGVPGK